MVVPTSTSSGRHQVLCSDNGGYDWSVLREGSTWYVFTGEQSRSTGFSVDLNTWQHLAAVFIPGTGIKFYKNGVEVVIPYIGYGTSVSTVNLGRNPDFGEHFAGTINEVAVYDTALTAAEIQKLYNRGLSGHDYLGDGIGCICDNCLHRIRQRNGDGSQQMHCHNAWQLPGCVARLLTNSRRGRYECVDHTINQLVQLPRFGIKQCCGRGWWKSDPDSCSMATGNVFEPDCNARVMDKLNSIPACNNPGTTAFGSLPLSVLEEEAMAKVVILDYNIQDSEITLLDSRIVNNEPPNHFTEVGAFQVSALSSQNEELRRIVLEDPWEFRLANVENFEQGMMMGDDVNFTVILPFIDLTKTVEVRDFETTALVHTADLSEVVLEFCRGESGIMIHNA